MLATAHDTTIYEVLRESFSLSINDGFWYPVEAPDYRALVRVLVSGSGYCVERRRTLESPWGPVATVPLHDFDPTAFRTWRRSWAAVAA